MSIINSLVSVIITNYNYEQYIAEAIESVLKQTYQYFELIIVDDGSTDNSREIIERYASQSPTNIKVIFKENGGQGSAFNAGFEVAEGDVVAFLDADDYWFENKLEVIVEYHRENTGVQHNLLINNEIPFALLENKVKKQKELLERDGFFGTIPTSGLSFSHEKLKKVFPIPEEYKICADLYLKMFFLNAGNDILSLNEAFANYRHHDNNLWYNNQSVTSNYNQKTLAYLNRNRKKDGRSSIKRTEPAKMYVNAGLDLDKVSSQSRIGIYGMGGIGKEVYTLLKSKGYSIQFFTDSNTDREGLFLNDIPIIPWNNIEKDNESYDLIIIASSAQTEIIHGLKKSSFPNDKYIGLYL